MRKDSIEHILSSAARIAPPACSIDEILERGRRRIRRTIGLALAASVVFLGVGTYLLVEPRPPVHLELEFVDAPVEAAGDRDDPPELFGP